MGRRAWCKLWALPFTDGELGDAPVAICGTFARLLAHTTDSKFADIGELKPTKKMGYSDPVLAEMLGIDPRTWEKYKEYLVEHGLIGMTQTNIIQILRWDKFQPPYRRESESASKTMSSTNSSTASSTVTPCSREGRGDKKTTSKTKGVTTPGDVSQLLDMGTMILGLRDECGNPSDGRSWAEVIGRYGAKRISGLWEEAKRDFQFESRQFLGVPHNSIGDRLCHLIDRERSEQSK